MIATSISGARLDAEAIARRWAEASAFAIGAGLMFTLSLVGELPVAELVSLGWAGWILWRRATTRSWPHPLLYSAAFLWLLGGLAVSFLGYAMSDLARGTALVDVLRGWARLAFLGIDALALTYLLARDWALLRWFVAGFVVGVVSSVLIMGPHLEDYWKFGFAYPISFLIAMLVPQRRTWLLCALFAGLGTLHLFLGARSLGAVCLIAAAMIWVPRVGRRARLIALAASLTVAGFAIRDLYVRSGSGDRGAGSTTERAAMLAFATDAFAKSPFVGQGSWFTKGQRVDAFFARRAEFRNEADRVNLTEDNEVVIHSQVLVALAEGGLLGGAFFIVFGWLLLWSVWFAAMYDFTLRPLVLILLLNGGWDLFMSPFSGAERIFIALSCAIAVALCGLRRASRLRT